jgi:hypothetical protein
MTPLIDPVSYWQSLDKKIIILINLTSKGLFTSGYPDENPLVAGS